MEAQKKSKEASGETAVQQSDPFTRRKNLPEVAWNKEDLTKAQKEQEAKEKAEKEKLAKAANNPSAIERLARLRKNMESLSK